MIGRVLKSCFRRIGYDVTTYPMPDWQFQRNSLTRGLAEIFAELRVNCVIDIGANHGQYGELIRQIGYKGRIVSFEPVSASFALLAQRAKDDPAWHIHKAAAGAADQLMDINVMDSDQFSSLLPTNSYGRNRYPEHTVVTRTEQVQVVRLDSVMADILSGLDEPRVYLKMDTQGYDLQVLEGAAGCLPLVLGLQSEIALRPIYEEMPDYLTSLARLNALGFGVTSIVPVSRDESLRVIEFDCLMVRNS